MTDPTSPRYDEERRSKERAAARSVAAAAAGGLLNSRRADAINELIPTEMRAKIKKWAKDNDCPFDEAITRLIGVGLDATKKQALTAAPAPRKPKASK